MLARFKAKGKPEVWNPQKSNWLKENRGIGFEDIVFLIDEGFLIDIITNSSQNYESQKIFVIEFQLFVYLVPFVENQDEIFLKTIIPSRKATKKYLGGKKNG